mmetsp:Transcript_1879/g.2701  ORF Transcript_1879/g.2701 Transcript_1879/m.2701 type:complete len:192 (-) Transcript_1879:540-1115(-)
MSALPLAKLGSLVLKTLAKPTAKKLRHTFQEYETTRAILVGLGQASHRLTSRMTIWSAGYKIRDIKPLQEDKAVEMGSEILTEGFLFTVAGGLVVWEYNKSKEKERLKEEKQRIHERNENARLEAMIHGLDVRMVDLEQILKEVLLQHNNNNKKQETSSSQQDDDQKNKAQFRNSVEPSKASRPRRWYHLY